MSTRQSREELIKKGLLKEVYEKGEAPHSEGEKESGQCCSFIILFVCGEILILD